MLSRKRRIDICEKRSEQKCRNELESILPGVQSIQKFIEQNRIEAKILILPPESTRTSALAAESIGCNVAEIAKSIGFFDPSNNGAILVILSGDKRVNLEKLSNSLGTSEQKALRKMTAEEVKSATGYSIGAVPPFAHDSYVRVLVDTSLFRFPHVWVAAGSSNSVMQIEPAVLTERLGLPKVDVSS